MSLNDKQEALCAANGTDFSELSAVILNCTLKRPEEESHTDLLLSVPAEIMRRAGVSVEVIRPAGMPIAFGVQPDMTEHGWPRRRLALALGEDRRSRDPDHRYANLAWRGELRLPADDRAALRDVRHPERARSEQFLRQGRRRGDHPATKTASSIAPCSILYALGHLGYTIPPQADYGWIGEAGAGAVLRR